MTSIPGIEKVLIANRGEIVVRVAGTLRRLDIASAAVVHALDADSPAARAVDEVCSIQGDTPVSAYLDAAQIIKAAIAIGADAIHPGYGFLAENADFAEAVIRAGIGWIGPPPAAMRLMGDKIESRRFAAKQNVPLTPSANEEDDPETFQQRALGIGLPLLIKASAGGGGKGMQIVRAESDLAQAIELARSEAERYFADGRIFAERYVDEPRHVEVQILADSQGTVLHLGERTVRSRGVSRNSSKNLRHRP
jgi:propionyl-CoA carboxylase alpha chain/3-methylcrotonyl-CoA carboxylase alpha subunit/acetyl-CoA/propionyl-CoA carboxylase biotin carboxyl carrier protein